jgi:hypothetical protein
VPVATHRFQRAARGVTVATAVRFVPGPRRPGDRYRLVVALDARPDESTPPPPGALTWACFGPAFGLRRDRVLPVCGYDWQLWADEIRKADVTSGSVA